MTKFYRRSLIVGYSAKEQASKSPAGIITFQWEDVGKKDVYVNGFITPSVAGTAYNHGVDEEVTPNWEKSAPQIQVRDSYGSYTILYYADDMWDEANEKSVAGWGGADGVLDTETKLSLGGGAWIKSPSADCTFTTAGAVASEETAVGGDTTISILAGGAFPVAFKLNDSKAVSWTLTAGTAYNHGVDEEVTPNWEKSAPQIQVRDNYGSYTILYYADDMWDEANEESVAGWGGADGVLDTETTVDVGGGFWLKQPNGDKKIFVTVKNPIK